MSSGSSLTGRSTVPGRRVIVEVYLFRCTPDGRLAYRRRSGRLRRAETPDLAAARIGAITSDTRSPFAVHSTSWRHLPGGTIVLTYAVLPDPQPSQPATVLIDVEVARSDRADRPTPDTVHRRHVAAHAARHLSLVARTDPQVRLVLSRHPALNRALAGLPVAPAGQLRVDPSLHTGTDHVPGWMPHDRIARVS